MSPERYIIVTNNPLVAKRWADACRQVDGTARDVLTHVRGLIHLGHRLLTHPLAGSVKPNETPYRSVIISERPDTTIDFDSLRIIEGAFAVADRFGPFRFGDCGPKLNSDFQLVDCTLMESAIDSMRA